MSTTVRPVTQTEVVDVNRAVTPPEDSPVTVAAGSMSNNIPTMITKRKLTGISWTGDIRNFLSFTIVYPFAVKTASIITIHGLEQRSDSMIPGTVPICSEA